MPSFNNPVHGWLRLEALTVFVAGLIVWTALDGGWLRFSLLFLLPDVTMAGYFLGPKFGAAAYNAVHSYVLPLALGVVGGVLDNRSLLLTSTLWLAHIGFDRMLGMGLKYPTGFRDTHLGRIGPSLVTDVVRQSGYPAVGAP